MGLPLWQMANWVNSNGVKSSGWRGELVMGVLDIDPLLETLHKLSDGRVLRAAELQEEGDFTRIRIPVKAVNTGDKADLALRRYAADWVRTRMKDHSVDTKFEKLPVGTSFYKDGKEERVIATLTLSWWPRPPLPDFELIKKMQQARKGPQPE